MTYEVDRDFRDFRRWNETYPLPHGDPTSGVHTIGKAQFRERFNAFHARADQVEGMLDEIEGIIGDAVSASNVPIFSTVTSAAAASINALLPVIYITGRTTSGSGGGYFVRVASTYKMAGRFQDATGQWWAPSASPGALQILNGTANIVVGVGTTGDFPDLPTAFERMLPYAANGGRIEVRLVSAITKGVLFQNADYSAFTITSSIGAVPLASGFEGVSDVGLDPPGDNKTNHLLMGYACAMPTLGCVIDMGLQGHNGYYAYWNVRRGLILQNCGVINAGYCGLISRGGSIVGAHKSIWNGAALHGIRAAHSATIAAQGAKADNCVQFPDLVDPDEYDDYIGNIKTAAAVDCSRGSSIFFRQGSAQNSGGSAMHARRASRIVAEDSNLSGARYHGIYASGFSTIAAGGAKVQNCGYGPTGALMGGYGVWCRDAFIAINGGIVTGSGNVGGMDIRLGDSDPHNSGAYVNASKTLTTRIYDAETGKIKVGSEYAHAITNIAGADKFNFPTRYGIVWNAAVESPWDIGIYSGTGETAGKTITGDRVLRSSVTSTDPRTHMTFANTNGIVAALRTTGSSGALENTSDEAIKARVAPIFEAWAERGVDGRELLDWLLDQFVGFDWLRTTDLEPTGEFGVGVIAQRLATRLPGLVTPREGEPGAEDWEPASVNYLGLLPYLGAAANLHREEIRDLRAQNAALEARLAALESRIS